MDNSSQQPVASQPPIPQQPLTASNEYYKSAGFSIRLGAAIVDGIILLVIAILLTFVLQALTGQSLSLGKNSPFQLLVALIAVIYNVALLAMQGATIGKKLVHIRVVNTSYQPIKLSQAIVRETIGKILSGTVFNLGYLWVAIDDKKQAWHDKIAKTFVIHDQPISHAEYLEAQQSKRSHLPRVLIILGVLESIQPFIMVFTVMPQLAKLYEDLNATGYSPTMSYGFVGTIIVIALAQIVYGVMLMSKEKSTGLLLETQKKVAKILFVIGVIAAVISIPIMIISVIAPIYNLTNSIK